MLLFLNTDEARNAGNTWFELIAFNFIQRSGQHKCCLILNRRRLFLFWWEYLGTCLFISRNILQSSILSSFFPETKLWIIFFQVLKFIVIRGYICGDIVHICVSSRTIKQTTLICFLKNKTIFMWEQFYIIDTISDFIMQIYVFTIKVVFINRFLRFKDGCSAKIVAIGVNVKLASRSNSCLVIWVHLFSRQLWG